MILSMDSLQHHKDTGNGATADGREEINGKGGKGKTEGQRGFTTRYKAS